MKKLFTLCFCILAGFAVQAQDNFPLQFVGSDGQVIPDGAVLNLTDIEIDELFGDMLMPAGISVANVSDETVYGGATYTIQVINNGRFQTCFPVNCMSHGTTGTFSTLPDAIMPGQLRDMRTEFLPNGDGNCIVVYQLQTFRKVGTSYFPDEDGPTITMRFATDPDGIGNIKGNKACTVTYYDLSGQQVERPKHGVFMKKTTYADGTFIVRKSVIR
jgi:hypothetical protein